MSREECVTVMFLVRIFGCFLSNLRNITTIYKLSPSNTLIYSIIFTMSYFIERAFPINFQLTLQNNSGHPYPGILTYSYLSRVTNEVTGFNSTLQLTDLQPPYSLLIYSHNPCDQRGSNRNDIRSLLSSSR